MNSFHVRLAFLLLHCITLTTLTSALICPKMTGNDSTDVTGRLDALVKANPRYSAQYTEPKTGTKYFYKWQICALVDLDTDAIIQTGEKLPRAVVIGRHAKAKLVGGTNWLMITYPNGEKIGQLCGGKARKSSVMVICDPKAVKGSFNIFEAYRDFNGSGINECYYLFELNNKAACSPCSGDKIAYSGSILLLLVLTVWGCIL